jgi:hypothetical protein
MSPRVTFWLLVALIASVGVSKAVQSDTLDLDLFWHLRVAEQLRSDGIGPIVDRISYSSIKEPWTPYSWLAELGMKWLWDQCSWRAAVAGEALLVAAILVTIALTCLAVGGRNRLLNAVIATGFAAWFIIPFVSFRPISFAILLLALCTWLLLRDRVNRSRLVWLVVPLTALTANVHLIAIVVPIWVACLLAGAVWEATDLRRYALLLLATTAACLTTPMLPGAARTAWFYQSKDVMVASRIIVEMRPIYGSVQGVLKVAACVALLIFSFTRVRRGEWLCLAATIVMVLRLGKFAPLAALIGAPILTVTLPPLSDRVLRKPAVAAAITVVLLVGLTRVVLSFPTARVPMDKWVNRRGPDIDSFPTAAADYVEASITPRSHRLINEFNWGGYLAWRLGEQYQVLLDGRTQLYPPQFWHATYLGTAADRAAILASADADAAVLPARKSRFREALDDLGWRIVYHDEFADVLVPPSPQ